MINRVRKRASGVEKIAQFSEDAHGFYPLFLEKDWQVAILNYLDGQGFGSINKVDVHFETDEVFILQKGTAILIATEVVDKKIQHTELIKMKEGVIYNIPKNCWHNIAMSKDAKVFIVEKSGTHKGDYEFFYLSDEDKNTLEKQIRELI